MLSRSKAFSALRAPVVVSCAISMPIAAALYLRPVKDRYEFTTRGGQLQRLDTATGEMTFCKDGACFNIDSRGRYVEGEDREVAASDPAQTDAAPSREAAPTLDQAEAMYNASQAQKQRTEEATRNIVGPTTFADLVRNSE